MAILPQPPAFSRKDIKREEELRRAAERAAMWQRRAVQEELTVPHFGKIGRPSNVLKLYQKKRALLSPRDAAAAFYALGRLNRNSAAKINRDPLANHPAAIELYADLVASAPYLPSREVANALLGAAYMRCSSEPVLTALCAAAAEKALTHFSQRDVASVVYSLGQLRRHDDELMPKLLSRVVSDASSFHAIEMMLTAHGLADLQLAPPTALTALSRAAVPNIDQFGAQELPRLLSSFASLGFHDEPLVRLAASQLPTLLTDMEPKGISEMFGALATARIWIPSALQALADEAVLKAESFGAVHVAVTLAALGRMQWDHPAAVTTLSARLLTCAQSELRDAPATAPDPVGAAGGTLAVGGDAVGSGARPLLGCALAEVAISMHALSRLPSARGAAAPPELVAISARLVEHLKREVGAGRRQAEFEGSEGLYGSAAIDAWMRDPQHCRDVAMLCNGAVQLGVQLPPELVQHLQQLMRAVQPEEAARMSSHAQPDRRATRRMRNELRELAGSLTRLEADPDTLIRMPPPSPHPGTS
jgi:hypothetical protein